MKSLNVDQPIRSWYTKDLTRPNSQEAWMMRRGDLKRQETGEKMTYSVILNETGKVIGSSSHGRIDWTEKDGTLRNHRSTQGNRRRDTVVYSISISEWPDIKSDIFKDLI